MNRRRFCQITTILIACAIASSGIPSPAVDAAIPWASWVPTSYTAQGWFNPSGARVTSKISNFLFTSAEGNANDTILYSELIVDPSNNTVLANYIDLEEATGAGFVANPFNEGIPKASKAALDAAIAVHTAERFTGSTLWDLIKFTFQDVWDSQLPGTLVSVENVKVSVHNAMLLDYGGYSGIGLVLFVNLGTKAAIIFDAGQNSSWGTTSTFTTTILSFVAGFIDPLAEILHAAGVDQGLIIASSSAQPATSAIHVSQSTSFLSSSEFLSLAGALMAVFPEPSFPFILQWNQIAIILVISVAIGLVIYYGVSSYSKEKKKFPEGQPREQPWYS
jgi:hypothetical protein